MSVNLIKNAILELKSKSKNDESFAIALEKVLVVFEDICKTSAINEIRVMANADGVPPEVKLVVHGLGDRAVDVPIKIPRMYDEIIEALAAVEHDQWESWSKTVSSEVSQERRDRWQKYWVPYDQLENSVQEHDRVWARKSWASIYQFLNSYIRERENLAWNTMYQAIMSYDGNKALSEVDLEEIASYVFEYAMMLRRNGYEGTASESDSDRES